MVEVFKTDVQHVTDAERVAKEIQAAIPGCKVNFDLQDCDHILRIKMDTGVISPDTIIGCVRLLGFKADVLPDTVPGVFPQLDKGGVTIFSLPFSNK